MRVPSSLGLILLLLIVGCTGKVLSPTAAPTKTPTAAPTATLTADLTVIEPGQSSTLSWTTTNATSVVIDKIGSVALSGQQTVTPSASVTYTITATGAGGTATAAVTITALAPVVVDTFHRPDQVGIGTADSGQDWIAVPAVAGTIPQIVNHTATANQPGDLVDDQAYYAFTILNQPIARGRATFYFAPNGTNTDQLEGFNLSTCADPTFTLAHCLHVEISRGQGGLTLKDLGNFNPLSNCARNYVFSPVLKNDGTIYTLQWTVIGNTVTVNWPDGSTATCTDPEMSNYAGNLVFFEPGYHMSDDSLVYVTSVRTFRAE